MRLRSAVVMALCLAGPPALQAQQRDTIVEVCRDKSVLYGCSKWEIIRPAQPTRVDTVKVTTSSTVTQSPAPTAGAPARPSGVTRRTTTSDRRIPVTKTEIVRIDTVLQRMTITVHDTVVRRDTVYATKYDTVYATRVVIQRKGFPWWRTLVAVAIASAATCEIASRQFGHDDWKFGCFDRPSDKITNNNTNINISLRSVSFVWRP